MSTITLTFGDCAENHVGMKQIGTKVDVGLGFTLDDLRIVQSKLDNSGYKTDLHILSNVNCPKAGILIIKNGVNYLLKDSGKTSIDLETEQKGLIPDKKYYDVRRKKVLNKHARWNLCFGEENQEPDYENGMGRIIAFQDLPITNEIRNKLYELCGEKAHKLQCEANYYYDVKKCGIGFHGDTERRKVIAVRLGETMDLHFQWYLQYKPFGEPFVFELNNGDMYIMSEKTTGYDWKQKNKLTLRHATGCRKYTTIKKK